LNEEISAVIQLPAGQMLDESQWLGSLTDAEAVIRSNQSFHSANNSKRNTNARLKLPA